MLTMTTCCCCCSRTRWLLFLVVLTGSAIGGIPAVPNTPDYVKAPLNNASETYPPGDKTVLGIEPLSTRVSGYESSKDEISSTTESPRSPMSTEIPRMGAVPAKNGSGHAAETGARSLSSGNEVAVVADEKSDARNSLRANITDLSDVSMDYDYKDTEGGEYSHSGSGNASGIHAEMPSSASKKEPGCVYGNETYAPGMPIHRNCEDRCVCGDDGRLTDCQPLCVSPFIRAGRGVRDPLCQEKLIPEQPCCATLVCAQDSEPEPEESCYIGNKTVARGDTVEEGCSKVCVCEARGNLKCRPRCPSSDSTVAGIGGSGVANDRDKCVLVPDPKDACCKITLCDVTLGDLDQFKPPDSASVDRVNVNLTKVEAVNATAIKLGFSNDLALENVTIQLSTDNLLWKERKLDKDGIVGDLEPSRTYHVRVVDEAGRPSGASMRVVLPSERTTADTSGYGVNATTPSHSKNEREVCYHRGKSYKVGAEWYDECISFCSCAMAGNIPRTECATIECPTDFGLDVLDPNCLDWEWVPADFVPKPPKCCSQEVRCRNNGSCVYQGKSYNNWSEIPSNVTGCEKRCYCELGNVSCHSACPPVPALPPANLHCPPSHASLAHLPEDECCLHWVCGDPSAATLPTKVGRNDTSTSYTGPLASDSFDRPQSFDDKMTQGKRNGTSDMPEWTVAQGLTDRYSTVVPRRKYHESSDLDPTNNPDPTDDYGRIHYPMDPGFPTEAPAATSAPLPSPPPYQGPYSPNFKPTSTRPSVEDVFRLTPRPRVKAPKDGPKSKTESKKPVEPVKPVPTIRTEKQTESPQNIVPGYVAVPPELPPDRQNNTVDLVFDRDNAPGPPSRPPQPPAGTYFGNSRPDLGSPRDPDDSDLPEELYRFIDLQHPSAHRLNEDHSLWGHGAVTRHEDGANEHDGIGQVQLFHPPGPSQFFNRQMLPELGGNHEGAGGANTDGYRFDRFGHGVPGGARQQIQELLLRVGEKDPNAGPFQRYPAGLRDLINRRPGSMIGPPRVTIPQLPQSLGPLTRLNHPLAGPDHGLPPGFLGPGGHGVQPSSDQITVQTLEAIGENRVRLVFTVPHVLVGLHGRVQVRYTSEESNVDPATWKSQIFAPPDDLIATPQLEFELGDLTASTEYKVMVTVKLRDLSNSPTSKIYKVTTWADPTTGVVTLPPQIPTDAELTVAEANSTWANIVWKKFTEYELQFIDGVQLRYKETEGKVYAATPLIHRAVTSYVIEKLKPAVTYQVGIYFIPFPGQTTELVSDKPISFTTAAEPDPYSFDIRVEIKGIKSTEVEVAWKGVPYPEDKYVNIYRAIYQSDTGKEDTSTFKIAKRDSPARTIIGELKPGTRYRLWIEVYLTNGRIKKSNVQDFVTKPGVSTSVGVVQQGLAAEVPRHEGDYYGPLVIVAIVASLAILSTLILLMILMKRRSSSKADISPRKTTAAYDNPSYKVEIQQETMDL